MKKLNIFKKIANITGTHSYSVKSKHSSFEFAWLMVVYSFISIFVIVLALNVFLFVQARNDKAFAPSDTQQDQVSTIDREELTRVLDDLILQAVEFDSIQQNGVNLVDPLQ